MVGTLSLSLLDLGYFSVRKILSTNSISLIDIKVTYWDYLFILGWTLGICVFQVISHFIKLLNLYKVVHNILSLLLLLPIGFVGMVLLLFLILVMSFLCLFFHICLAKGKGFLGGWDGKESTCNAGDPGLIPGMWQSPRERNGYPLQYSCLENSVDRGAWHPKMHGCLFRVFFFLMGSQSVGHDWATFTLSAWFTFANT